MYQGFWIKVSLAKVGPGKSGKIAWLSSVDLFSFWIYGTAYHRNLWIWFKCWFGFWNHCKFKGISFTWRSFQLICQRWIGIMIGNGRWTEGISYPCPTSCGILSFLWEKGYGDQIKREKEKECFRLVWWINFCITSYMVYL